ncbi:hypothetical protein [Aquabacterium sp. OR-4]|uniref:hypothetical protein n=1 Tax=Aquabacterium sp. OR-4 TaxID=2978127 RepID=UPI0021B2D210|nr:hypothetical protein [Aquabacterium sp. OR-4]MDT7837507.1 hypothetical protein [Aquabacterium sp. OR-4]
MAARLHPRRWLAATLAAMLTLPIAAPWAHARAPSAGGHAEGSAGGSASDNAAGSAGSGTQAAALQACRADARQRCPGARPGDGQLLACLQAQQAALAPACREALPALAACRDTLQRLCGEAAGAQRRACLQRHRSELAGCAPAR